MYIEISKFLISKIFKLLFIYAGFTFFLFIYYIVALNILHSVTALTNSSSFSCGFLQFDSPYFLINNILSSPKIFNLQLISLMF